MKVDKVNGTGAKKHPLLKPLFPLQAIFTFFEKNVAFCKKIAKKHTPTEKRLTFPLLGVYYGRILILILRRKIEMKKLSTIIALALIVTIGGVYAAWHYDRGAVSLEITRSATMASIQSDTPMGSISIDQSANSGAGNTLKFLVDDVDAKDWVAALVPSGSVWVKFTPASNADAAVKDNGIN